jgi:hypothetical protein
MSMIEMVLFMAIVNGNPSNPEPVQEDSAIVMMEDVKKKKKKGKKISGKGKKKKKGFFSKVFGSK